MTKFRNRAKGPLSQRRKATLESKDSTMSNAIATPETETTDTYAGLNPQQAAFQKLIDDTMTNSAEKEAAEILNSTEPAVVTVTPAIAAAILRNHNKRNRNLVISKVEDYSAAMNRGEWELNHQGLASYEGGELADGQHRCGAILKSGKDQQFTVFRISKQAAATIDLSKGRTAGDAMELEGIENAKPKATIAKDAMAYRDQVEHGRKLRYSIIQTKKWAMAHDALLGQAWTIGAMSDQNVSEPCLSHNEAGTIAALMLLGGYSSEMTVAFLAAVQQGVAPYHDSPTTELARKLTKAKYADRSRDKMTKFEKLAITAKAADAFAQEKSVAKLVWKASKESLPSFEYEAE